MGKYAEIIKQELVDIGVSLGLHVIEEAQDTFFLSRVENAYDPRIDLLWSLQLTESQYSGAEKVRSWLGEKLPRASRYFPLVGFEIEATDPTTKTQVSNLANLKALRVPFGFLVVDNQKGSRDLYRRATRLIRTFNAVHGHSNYGVIDKSNLFRFREFCKSIKLSGVANLASRSKGGKGGETAKTKEVRQRLDFLGRKYGFHVDHDWAPSNLKFSYRIAQEIYDLLGQPQNREVKYFLGRLVKWSPADEKEIDKWTQYYTGSFLDLVWATMLPQGLSIFMKHILKTNLEMRYSVLNDFDEPYPIFGFEIEKYMGKHGGGAVLNLSRTCHTGLVVVPEKEYENAVKKIKTYRVSNVFAVSNHDVMKSIHG